MVDNKFWVSSKVNGQEEWRLAVLMLVGTIVDDTLRGYWYRLLALDRPRTVYFDDLDRPSFFSWPSSISSTFIFFGINLKTLFKRHRIRITFTAWWNHCFTWLIINSYFQPFQKYDLCNANCTLCTGIEWVELQIDIWNPSPFV